MEPIPFNQIIICSAALTLLAGLMVPVQFSPVQQYQVEITITAQGTKSHRAKNSEVWMSEYPSLGLIASENSGGWERRKDALVSTQLQPATVFWKGWISSDYRLSFRRNSYSGNVLVKVNGKTKEFDLFSEFDSRPLQISPFEFLPESRASYGWSILKGIFTLMGLFILIYSTLFFMIRRSGAPTASISISSKLLVHFALPSLIIYSVTLLAMWPAQMSSDAVSHWAEIHTREFEDNHPALLTMAMWVVTRIWHSPTIIPIFQIFALTAVTAILLVKLRDLGVPLPLCYIGAVGFPLYPANALMVTSIMKDVPYSIALTLTFYLSVTLIQSRGKAAHTLLWRTLYCAALIVVIFSRHNGILLAVTLPLFSAIVYRNEAGRFFIVVPLTLIALLFFVKVIAFPLAHVNPLAMHYKAVNAMHILAAYKVNGTSFSPDEERLLSTIYPLDRWSALYRCYTYDLLFFGNSVEHPSYESLSANVTALNNLALKRVLEDPLVYWRHQRCVTSILWQINQPLNHFMNTVPLGIADFPLSREYGLVSTPKILSLNKAISSFVFWSTNTKRSWLFWRPGLWLLVTLVIGFGLSFIRRDKSLLLLMAPSVLNTISLLPVIGSQDYRYQYCAQIVGIFILLLAFSRNFSGGLFQGVRANDLL